MIYVLYYILNNNNAVNIHKDGQYYFRCAKKLQLQQDFATELKTKLFTFVIYGCNLKSAAKKTAGAWLNKPSKGASINYVDRQGGDGVSQMPILLHQLMQKTSLRRREGVKNWQNLAYVVYGCPLIICLMLSLVLSLSVVSYFNTAFS